MGQAEPGPAGFREVSTQGARFAQHAPFVLIAGPCQLESLDHALMLAGRLQEICGALDIPLVFKASYDKANRSSLKGVRGLGLEKGLEILGEVRARTGLATLTDVHEPDHCAKAAQACDILQIPAFLCRQTDLLLAAGETGAAINVKKASSWRRGT